MSAAILLPELLVGKTIIPAGDAGEQFIAGLTLSVISVCLGAEQAARDYAGLAYEIAATLKGHGHTYYPPGVIKLVRLICTGGDSTETFHIPIVNDTLVIPDFDIRDILVRLKGGSPDEPAVLSRMQIPQFRLRLRPATLSGKLYQIEKKPYDQLIETLEETINSCLQNEVIITDQIEIADDYLTVAGNLVGMNNLALAELALQEVGRAFEAYGNVSGSEESVATAQELKGVLEKTIKMLRGNAV